MPELVKLEKQLGDKVHIIAVSMDLVTPMGTPQNAASIKALATKRGFDDLDVVLYAGDPDALLDSPWNLPDGLPFSLVLDGNGKEIARHTGPSRVDQFRAMLGLSGTGG